MQVSSASLTILLCSVLQVAPRIHFLGPYMSIHVFPWTSSFSSPSLQVEIHKRFLGSFEVATNEAAINSRRWTVFCASLHLTLDVTWEVYVAGWRIGTRFQLPTLSQILYDPKLLSNQYSELQKQGVCEDFFLTFDDNLELQRHPTFGLGAKTLVHSVLYSLQAPWESIHVWMNSKAQKEIKIQTSQGNLHLGISQCLALCKSNLCHCFN